MMAELDFNWRRRLYSNDAVAYVGNDRETAPYRVRMVRDDSPGNPFTDWDGHWPMIVGHCERYGRDFTEYDKAPGAAVDDPLSHFTAGQIIRHQRAILDALGTTCVNSLTGHSWSLEQDFAEHMQDYCQPGDCRAEIMRDYFRDRLGDVSASDRLEAMAALYALIGIQTLRTSSHGYSQGDYAELLIVATPEAMAAFGWPKAKQRDVARIAKDMEGQAKLYSAWAWGDVYGFILERAPADADERDDDDAWEEVDSCWGFYGDDPEWSGLSDAALDALRYADALPAAA